MGVVTAALLTYSRRVDALTGWGRKLGRLRSRMFDALAFEERHR
jgi:hypothetical protein